MIRLGAYSHNIGNALLLRGDIELAAQRESVTYEYMAQRVGDYLLDNCPDVDVTAALSIMPLTTRECCIKKFDLSCAHRTQVVWI